MQYLADWRLTPARDYPVAGELTLEEIADRTGYSSPNAFAATEQLVSEVKDGGMFASVIGVPESAKTRPSVRTVAFVSKQSPETIVHMAKAVRDGTLKIPISQQLPLRDARQGHIAVERGAGGKVLLLP